jgi:hypothetical protein
VRGSGPSPGNIEGDWFSGERMRNLWTFSLRQSSTTLILDSELKVNRLELGKSFDWLSLPLKLNDRYRGTLEAPKWSHTFAREKEEDSWCTLRGWTATTLAAAASVQAWERPCCLQLLKCSWKCEVGVRSRVVKTGVKELQGIIVNNRIRGRQALAFDFTCFQSLPSGGALSQGPHSLYNRIAI